MVMFMTIVTPVLWLLLLVACSAQLVRQVDAGADFVITQFFYDTEAFLSFVKRCREVGITCPIIPGIMAIQVGKRR